MPGMVSSILTKNAGTALLRQNGYETYFDSLVHLFTVNFARYLNVNCSPWISRFCGHYCVYYCMLRSKDINVPKIVSSFTSDTALNDVLVHGFVCRIVNN